MRRNTPHHRRLIVVVTVALVLMLGCMPAPSELSNQGGGNIITAGVKISAGSLSNLTPDEIQIVAGFITEVAPQIDVDLDDDQAAAIQTFLELNNLDSIADIRVTVEQAIENPDSLELPDGFLELFANIDTGMFEDIEDQSGL